MPQKTTLHLNWGGKGTKCKFQFWMFCHVTKVNVLNVLSRYKSECSECSVVLQKWMFWIFCHVTKVNVLNVLSRYKSECSECSVTLQKWMFWMFCRVTKVNVLNVLLHYKSLAYTWNAFKWFETRILRFRSPCSRLQHRKLFYKQYTRAHAHELVDYMQHTNTHASLSTWICTHLLACMHDHQPTHILNIHCYVDIRYQYIYIYIHIYIYIYTFSLSHADQVYNI
jgi:hypothetical protein